MVADSCVRARWGVWLLCGGCNGTATMDEDACMFMLAHLAQPSIFNDLRTQKQLGYFVNAHGHRAQGGSTGINLVVQSSTASATALATHIEDWLESFTHELEDLSDAALQSSKEAVSQRIMEKPRSMCQRFEAWQGEMGAQTYDFGRAMKRAKAIQRLTKVSWWWVGPWLVGSFGRSVVCCWDIVWPFLMFWVFSMLVLGVPWGFMWQDQLVAMWWGHFVKGAKHRSPIWFLLDPEAEAGSEGGAKGQGAGETQLPMAVFGARPRVVQSLEELRALKKERPLLPTACTSW